MNRNDLLFLTGSSALMKARAAAGGYALPGGGMRNMAQFERKDESPQMSVFKQRLRSVSEISTVGKTFLGISPHSLALEEVAGLMGELRTPDEQVQAVDSVLEESYQLPPGQNVRVISKVIQDLISPDRVVLDDRAMSRVGQRILKAGLQAASNTMTGAVPVARDSYLDDMLKAHIAALVEYPLFGFSRGVQGLIEEVGLSEPLADQQFNRYWDDTPECLAHWLKGEIDAVVNRQIEPDDYALLLDHTVTLPDAMQGATLTRIIDTFDNGLQLAGNEMVAMEVLDISNKLPMHLRMPPLKAFHGMLSKLPHSQARSLYPVLLQSVKRITEMPYFRKNRTHKHLLGDLIAKGHALEHVNFAPNETLEEAQIRCVDMDWEEAAAA